MRRKRKNQANFRVYNQAHKIIIKLKIFKMKITIIKQNKSFQVKCCYKKISQ